MPASRASSGERDGQSAPRTVRVPPSSLFVPVRSEDECGFTRPVLTQQHMHFSADELDAHVFQRGIAAIEFRGLEERDKNLALHSFGHNHHYWVASMENSTW